MARILLAWEIGDGNGHVRNLLAVADLLRAAGHQAVFALSATQVSAKNLAEANGYPVEQIMLPHYPAMTQYLPPMANYRADSFLDVMGIHAFDSEDRLAPMLARYRIIIEQNAIDVVIAETAPVAWLAARIANRPCLGVGTSFGLPEVREGFATYPQFDKLAQHTDLLRRVDHEDGQPMREGSVQFASRSARAVADSPALLSSAGSLWESAQPNRARSWPGVAAFSVRAG